jgi:N-dimethylarginine dimethylaminohydrolase
MKQVLLCPPTHYRVEYVINPWMDVNNPVDPKLANKQFLELEMAYAKLGIKINKIDQDPELPDMIYSANYGFPFQLGKKKIFIPANFKFDQRKKESEHAKKYFKKNGFEIRNISENITWEGQGDLLKVGDTYLLGWGKRSDRKAKNALAELLEVNAKDIIDFRLTKDGFYHLDTCLLPINSNTVAINASAFDDQGLKKINKIFRDVIKVSAKDNKLLACNGIVTEDAIVVGKGVSEDLKNKFLKRGYKTVEVPMGESLKGGGSVKCNTLEYY